MTSKPIAWRIYRNNRWDYRDEPSRRIDQRAIWQPLYAHRQEWQGLTVEEIAQGNKESWVTKQAWESAVWWAEEKLKEKNGE